MTLVDWLYDEFDSLINKPGLGFKNGDYLLTINGSAMNSKRLPNEVLVNQAKEVVMLRITGSGQDGESSGVSKPRNVLVKTLNDEAPARYRE
jgi:hypothetical protein